MRLKKVFVGALAAAMLVCAVAVPAFAAEEVEQENCLSSSYVQMNIPYADFYKAAGVDNASEIDAVTSATKNQDPCRQACRRFLPCQRRRHRHHRCFLPGQGTDPVGAEECKAGHRCRQLRHHRYPEGPGIHYHLYRCGCPV